MSECVLVIVSEAVSVFVSIPCACLPVFVPVSVGAYDCVSVSLSVSGLRVCVCGSVAFLPESFFHSVQFLVGGWMGG